MTFTDRHSGRLPTGSGGFTLIELLVVVSIVVLLIAILLPALKNARETAKATACLANTRQQGIAAGSYFTDFRGRFPVKYNYNPNGSKTTDTDFAIRAISRELTGSWPGTGSRSLLCPSSPTGSWLNSYGFNSDHGGWSRGNGAQLSDVVSPSDKVYAIDFPHVTLYLFFNAKHVSHPWYFIPGAGQHGITYDEGGYTSASWQRFWRDLNEGRHAQTISTLFVDGHSRMLPVADVVQQWHYAGTNSKNQARNNMFNLYLP